MHWASNEGAHAAMKFYLHDGTGDLLTVISAIHTKIQGDIHEIRAEQAMSEISKPGELRFNHLFDDVINHATVYALKKESAQYEKLYATTDEAPLSSCSRFFTSAMGLPCAHALELLMTRRQKISLRLIHPHWWYYRSGVRPTKQEATAATAPTPGTLLAIQEPARIPQGLGRPKKADKFTKRLPSAFELTHSKQLTSQAKTAASTAPPAPSALSATAYPRSVAPGSTASPPSAPKIKAPPSVASTPTTASTQKRKTRGPDKKPRAKRAKKTQEVEAAAGVNTELVGVERTMAAESGLAVVREAAVDADIEADEW